MRDLVIARGVEAIGRDAGLAYTAESRSSTRMAHPSTFLGVQPLGTAAFLGVGLPFGRIVAEDFAKLTSVVVANGAHQLRLTPWRAILVPVSTLPAARVASTEMSTETFVLDPDDQRRRIAACRGAPSCSQGTTPVQSDATRLAAEMAGALGPGITLHVSGCEKGCANPHSAPVTLVGQNGQYHLVRNGVPSDPPVLRDLTLDQAAEQVRQFVSVQTRGSAI
jgi:precorrin-3B synthase